MLDLLTNIKFTWGVLSWDTELLFSIHGVDIMIGVGWICYGPYSLAIKKK